MRCSNVEKMINNTAPDILVLCIDSKNADDVLGRVYSKFQIEPTVFNSSFDLMVKMDEFFDRINFPQASLKTRSFNGKPVEAAGERPKEIQKVADMMEHRGDLATFVVHVQYRQNATWQGKIVWTDKKKESTFRSALEMIKLMDEAIGEEPVNNKPVTDKGEGDA